MRETVLQPAASIQIPAFEVSSFSGESAIFPFLPKRPSKTRPKALFGTTLRLVTGCGPIHVIINRNTSGIAEIFLKMGKAGGCAASQAETIGRLLSLAAKHQIPMTDVIKQLIGVSCHNHNGHGEDKIYSCSDAVAKALKAYLEDEGLDLGFSSDFAEVPEAGACPKCGSTLTTSAGKTSCTSCEFSR